MFRYNTKGVKIFNDNTLPEELSHVECGKFYRLMKYIVGNNQLLGYRTSEGIRPIGIEKMSEILGSSERHTKRFVQRMKEYNILKEIDLGTNRWFIVNPKYAFKGKFLSMTVFIVFHDELKDELPQWVLRKFMEGTKE